MNTMYVKAAPGLKFPREGEPRRYITDAEPESVIGSHFYRKAVTDGDLIELTAAEWSQAVAQRAQADAEQAQLAAAATKAAAKAAAKESK
jgi:hypothetical protein